MDPLKHANSAGTSRHGGVIALAGDDHGCQSSTLAHQSEQVFAAAMMPVLNPATLQDYLDLGILGFALSRYSGCWVGFKAISETVESSASIFGDPTRIEIVTPDDFAPPPDGLWMRWPDPPLAQERRLNGPKMQAVAAFARANKLDRIVLDSRPARLGILATGKAYLDLRQALADLGITDDVARQLGLRIYKVALTWPLEEAGARRFAEGLEDVLVVEEKRGFVEDQLVRILYNLDASKRPMVVGKRDETGAALLPSDGELTPTIVAGAVIARLRRLGHADLAREQRLARLELLERSVAATTVKLQRTPYFCSGCPHNSSTKIPDGSRAMAGIGCHGMALYIPSRRTTTISHMGGEGVAWIGQAPFTSEPHVFQNMGDGTYTHSGLLALRAAAAAGVNITYKILYNDAVAMTGGQPAEGSLSVAQIAHQIAAEGAKRIAVVSDEPGKYPGGGYFPAGATIHHRRELDALQRELREIAGLSVLIYDQTCAAEKRGGASAASIPTRRSGRSSTISSAKDAATARRRRTAFRFSRWRRSSAASARSTSPIATRISPASKVFARALSPCTTAGRNRRSSRRSPSTICSAICRSRRRGHWSNPTTSSSPASAAPASSPSAPCSEWPRISKARDARRSTLPASRRRTARS